VLTADLTPILVYAACAWLPTAVAAVALRDWYPALPTWWRLGYEGLIAVLYIAAPIALVGFSRVGLRWPGLVPMILYPAAGFISALVILLALDRILPSPTGQRLPLMQRPQLRAFAAHQFVLATVSSEIMFRGYLLLEMGRGLGAWPAFGIQLGLFALDHLPRDLYALPRRQVWSAAFLHTLLQHLIIGGTLGLVALGTQSILPSIALHIYLMVVIFIVFSVSTLRALTGAPQT